jgi:hypothetical protein
LADTEEPGRLPGADELSPRRTKITATGELAGILSAICRIFSAIRRIFNKKPAMAARGHHGRTEQTPRHSTQNGRPAHAETQC